MKTFNKCCDNQPIVIVEYDENENFPGKIAVCQYHWDKEDENGRKYWQRWTKSIKFLNRPIEAAIPQ